MYRGEVNRRTESKNHSQRLGNMYVGCMSIFMGVWCTCSPPSPLLPYISVPYALPKMFPSPTLPISYSHITYFLFPYSPFPISCSQAPFPYSIFPIPYSLVHTSYSYFQFPYYITPFRYSVYIFPSFLSPIWIQCNPNKLFTFGLGFLGQPYATHTRFQKRKQTTYSALVSILCLILSD